MESSATKFFSGTTEVKRYAFGVKNSAWLKSMGAVRIDSFSRMIGYPLSGYDAILPITRVISYKKNPSLHKCDARCINATGKNCECACGGSNHGAGNI
jgi:hypothetical protein